MNNKGFTLVELLAVVILLAVLLLIATPAMFNVLKSSEEGLSEVEANTIYDYSKNFYYSNKSTFHFQDNYCLIRYNTDLIDKGFISSRRKDNEVYILVNNLDASFEILDDNSDYINCTD